MAATRLAAGWIRNSDAIARSSGGICSRLGTGAAYPSGKTSGEAEAAKLRSDKVILSPPRYGCASPRRATASNAK